jgi:DNA-binding response OmpR family regulator
MSVLRWSRGVLAHAGYEVVVAHDGDAALAFTAEQHFARY